MKKILIIILITAIGCSKPIDKLVDETNSKICQIIKNDFSSKSFLEAKKIFQTEIIDKNKKSLDKNKLPEYYSKLRDCFPGIKFSKKIKDFDADYKLIKARIDPLELVGNPLNGNPYELVLEGEQTPAFNMKIKFIANYRIKDTSNLEIKGKISFFDVNKQIIEEYNLYPTPDFYKYSKLGKGSFIHIAYFDALWNPYSDSPFDDAAKVLNKINKVEYYKISLNFSGNLKLDKKLEKEKKQDKKDEEIIDNLEIK